MENVTQNKNWVIRGLVWGSFMFLALSIVLPLMDNAQLDGFRIIKSLVIWLAMGLAFGFVMKKIEGH